RVDTQILGLDDDVDAIVDFGDHENGRERSVAARLLIEGRNAYETMDAALTAEHAVSIFSDDLHGGGLDARFLAGCGVKHGSLKAFALSPAKIHAQEHLGPVHRF